MIPSKFHLTSLGKAEWRPMLAHLAELHEGSVHAPLQNLPYRWEESAPQTPFSPFFGHWDSIHIAYDQMVLDPQLAICQILNLLALQESNGLIPGYVQIIDHRLSWSSKITAPPLWPFIVQEYLEQTGQEDVVTPCYEALIRQIKWFETHRKTAAGFYYLDCQDHFWESGVEEGIRFDLAQGDSENLLCIDASSHLYALYTCAAQWAAKLELAVEEWKAKAQVLGKSIQSHCYDEETHFFYDAWTPSSPERRRAAFEGIWPLVTGAATPQQAQQVIFEHLLDSSRFFTAHPIPTVSLEDPAFELRHWRGPTRNSMTFWAAKGCLRYHYPKAACQLLERALDATYQQFQRTGSIWEYYHPQLGDQASLSRYAHLPASGPLKNSLGHNPLIAMARLWEISRAL